jgi:excisionase family DNA binding protein
MIASNVQAGIRKRLYTVEETAEYLGRTPWAVRHMIWNGMLPAVKIGRRIQVDIRDMDALIERSKSNVE